MHGLWMGKFHFDVRVQHGAQTDRFFGVYGNILLFRRQATHKNHGTAEIEKIHVGDRIETNYLIVDADELRRVHLSIPKTDCR